MASLHLTRPLVIAACMMLGAGTAASGRAQDSTPSDGWLLTMPKRRAADAPPAAPPALPAGADRIAPVTIDFLVRQFPEADESKAVRQTVSRTPDRIHLTGNDGREWLFERNPIDPRRVSAAMTDHGSQTIVLHDDTELRITLGISGWAEVLALGFDPQSIAKHKPTRDVRAIGPFRFVRYVDAGRPAPFNEVWWSPEQILPSSFALADGVGTRRFSVQRARPGVQAELLRAASVRFPKYRVIDVADWREKH